MIDFTNCSRKNKAYSGANGNKIAIIYQNEMYMLKFPPPPSINQEMSYTNSCISEYIGCHIFESVGIAAQKTLLGKYVINGKEKIVVACKDFTSPGIILQDFASLKNQMIVSERNGYGTELDDILSTIDEQTAMDREILSDYFWDMFIVDAWIGNWDRHNGNWGFLYNTLNDKISLAPIFDCGSSLYPQADDHIMHEIFSNKSALYHRIYNMPLSSIKIGGKKINYFQFISSLQNDDCNRALHRIMSRISLEAVMKIIDEIPMLSELQRKFYKTMIQARKELILDHSFSKLRQAEQRRQRGISL